MIEVDEAFFTSLLLANLPPTAFITKSRNTDEDDFYNTIVDEMNNQVKAAREWLESDEAKEIALHETKLRQEAFSTLESKMTDILNEKADTVEEHIQNFYDTGSKLGCDTLGKEVVFTDADKLALYYTYNNAFDQVKNLSTDVTSQIRENIWRGIGEGQSMQKVSEALQNIPIEPLTVGNRELSPKVRADMIARTETARAVNAGTIQSYSNYGVELVDTLPADDACEDCIQIAEDGPYTLAEASDLLPAHVNCRCAFGPHIDLENISDTPVDNPDVVDMTTTDSADSETISAEDLMNNNVNPSFEELSTNEEVANYFGYDVEHDAENNVTRFIDNEFNTSLVFPDNREGVLEIKDMLKAYNESPDTLKATTNNIFNNSSLRQYVLGSCRGANVSMSKDIELKQYTDTLHHEMTHALEYNLPKNMNTKIPQRYSDIKKGENNLYRQAVKADAKANGLRGLGNSSSDYGASFASSHKGSCIEDFAEAGMAVLMDDESTLKTTYGELTREQWIEKYPNRAAFMQDLMKNPSNYGAKL